MHIIDLHILPRFERVVRLIAQNPSRDDFGYADLPTLLCLLMLAIPISQGDRRRIINIAMRQTAYDRASIEFMLDQYHGKDEQRHLWRRDSRGKYRLLV